VNVGDTFFGLDEKNHLWIILSDAADDGSVVAVNFTTHDLARRTCSLDCLVVAPGEHPYPTHDSCIYYLGASMPNLQLIRDRVASGRYEAHEPVSAPLLERIRMGALTSEADEAVKAAIRQSR
jgi:hypothetical protein